MITKYYHAPSKADFDTALDGLFTADADGETVEVTTAHKYGKRADLDALGTIYNRDGVYDENGDTVTPPTEKDGYFVNLYHDAGFDLPEGLSAYEVAVSSAHRKIFEQVDLKVILEYSNIQQATVKP